MLGSFEGSSGFLNIDMYGLLFRSVSECSFLENSLAVEIPGIKEVDIKKAKKARDMVIDEWNRWVYKQPKEKDFLLFKHEELEEPIYESETDILYMPGEKVLLGFRCESVLVSVNITPVTLVIPGEGEMLLYEREDVSLHYIPKIRKRSMFMTAPLINVPSVELIDLKE